MLEIEYFSSLYAQFRLLIVTLKIWAKDFAAETLKATMIMWSDYSVIRFSYNFSIS